jgi:hypothetical protein
MGTDKPARQDGVTYDTIWRSKWVAEGAETVGEMIEKLLAATKDLREMEVAGVTLENVVDEGYGCLITDDPEVAERFGFTRREDETDEPPGDPSAKASLN